MSTLKLVYVFTIFLLISDNLCMAAETNKAGEISPKTDLETPSKNLEIFDTIKTSMPVIDAALSFYDNIISYRMDKIELSVLSHDLASQYGRYMGSTIPQFEAFYKTKTENNWVKLNEHVNSVLPETISTINALSKQRNTYVVTPQYKETMAILETCRYILTYVKDMGTMPITDQDLSMFDMHRSNYSKIVKQLGEQIDALNNLIKKGKIS